MFEITQKKLGVFTRTVRIDPVKKVLTFTVFNSINKFSKTSQTVSLLNINTEEVKIRRLAVVNLFVFLFVSIMTLAAFSEFYKEYVQNNQLLPSSALIPGLLIVVVLALYAISTLGSTIVYSSEQSHYKKLSDGSRCLSLFSSGAYEADYEHFKERLEQEINNAVNQNTVINLIKQMDTEILINVFREVYP